MLTARAAHDPERVRALAAEKLLLVKRGRPRARIEQRITDMGASYDATVQDVAPDAPRYREAADRVLARLDELLP